MLHLINIIKKLLTFIAMLWAFTSGILFSETIKIYGDDHYPPVCYLEKQNPRGIMIEILRQIEFITGDHFQFELLPWKRAFVSAERGVGGIVGLSKTSEREIIFDYSDPLYEDDIYIVVHQGHELPFKTLADLKGKKIGIQLGASYGNEVDLAISNGLFPVESVLNQVSRMKMVLHDRVDAAFFGNGLVGLDLLFASDTELSAARKEFVVLPTPLSKDLLYLGLPKSMNKKQWLIQFNKALAEIKAKKILTEKK
jgi:ABC-type amino acid transport substrate-binding protein